MTAASFANHQAILTARRCLPDTDETLVSSRLEYRETQGSRSRTRISYFPSLCLELGLVYTLLPLMTSLAQKPYVVQSRSQSRVSRDSRVSVLVSDSYKAYSESRSRIKATQSLSLVSVSKNLVSSASGIYISLIKIETGPIIVDQVNEKHLRKIPNNLTMSNQNC